MHHDGVIGEVVLPLRALAQPRPAIVDGGDCGACVLGALGDCDIPTAYKAAGCEHGPKAFDWLTMRDALTHLFDMGVLDRAALATPMWPSECDDSESVYGLASWSQVSAWFYYALMALDGGYYGVASINADGNGPGAPTNHVVMICGARAMWGQVRGADRRVCQVYVSDPKAGGEASWYDADGLLLRHGGFNTLWVRPWDGVKDWD